MERAGNLAIFLFFVFVSCVQGGPAIIDMAGQDSGAEADADPGAGSGGGTAVISGEEYCDTLVGEYGETLDACCGIADITVRENLLRFRRLACRHGFDNENVGHDWDMVNACLGLELEALEGCNFGVFVPLDEASEHVCTASSSGLRQAGEFCSADRECAPGLDCYETDKLCVSKLAQGEDCSAYASDPEGKCEAGFFCDGEVCVPLPEWGERCTGRIAENCAPGLYCAPPRPVDPGDICRPLKDDGERCEENYECASGFCGMASGFCARPEVIPLSVDVPYCA